MNMERLVAAHEKIANGLLQTAELFQGARSLEISPGADLRSQQIIVGVGIGSTEDVGDADPGTPCLIVYTSEPLGRQNAASYAASAFNVDSLDSEDVPLKVIHTGPIDAYAHRFRLRPAPAGISVGHVSITAGTLGALCRGRSEQRRDRLLALSNNHVLANVNAGAIGDAIVQPGPYDGGKLPADKIAVLERFVPIAFGPANQVDAATAWVDPALVRPDTVYLNGTTPKFFRTGTTPKAAAVGMLVGKSGRTTQLTSGRITATRVTINVNMGAGRIANFVDQIAVVGTSGTFSSGGDSGSLIWTWDERRDPVALLFAGGGGTTFGNPIDLVLNALDVVLV